MGSTPSDKQDTCNTAHKQQRSVLIIARHGARLDYEMREAGSNWVAAADRPHDPPLSSTGHQQARALGDKIHTLLRENGLGSGGDGMRVNHVYTSPLLRCCQTASGAINRLNEIYGKGGEEEKDQDTVKLSVEHGLVESMSLSWYTSWCLPGSDSTWGFHQKLDSSTSEKFLSQEGVDEMKSKINICDLAHQEVTETLLSLDDLMKHADFADKIQSDYTSLFNLREKNYKWSDFETRQANSERMEYIAKAILARHSNECILLVSHGGPTTHMYEQLTGNHWDTAPVCGYTGTSIYIDRGKGVIENLVVNV